MELVPALKCLSIKEGYYEMNRRGSWTACPQPVQGVKARLLTECRVQNQNIVVVKCFSLSIRGLPWMWQLKEAMMI